MSNIKCVFQYNASWNQWKNDWIISVVICLIIIYPYCAPEINTECMGSPQLHNADDSKIHVHKLQQSLVLVYEDKNVYYKIFTLHDTVVGHFNAGKNSEVFVI